MPLCACGCGEQPVKGRFVRGHSWRDPEIIKSRVAKIRGRKLTEEQRRTIAQGRIDGWKAPYYVIEDRGYESPCWIWARAMLKTGYGAVRREGKSLRAHRWMYEQHRDPIPEGLMLDHLCKVKACVNPAHLEPVTRSVNQLRDWQQRRSAG